MKEEEPMLQNPDDPPLTEEDGDKEPEILDGLMSQEKPGECEGTKAEELLAMKEESGRERLKRHRVEMAGKVWIPDTWGQEDLLKGWMDCSTFDSDLVPKGIMSARAALVKEGRTTHSGRIGWPHISKSKLFLNPS